MLLHFVLIEYDVDGITGYVHEAYFVSGCEEFEAGEFRPRK